MQQKIYHKASLVNRAGRISPLCAANPRPVDLRRELWTLRWEAVTCPKCLAMRDEKGGESDGRHSKLLGYE